MQIHQTDSPRCPRGRRAADVRCDRDAALPFERELDRHQVRERKRGEETLRHIGLGMSATTGQEFLKGLAEQLCRTLQTDFAFIVELVGRGKKSTASLTLAEHGTARPVAVRVDAEDRASYRCVQPALRHHQ